MVRIHPLIQLLAFSMAAVSSKPQFPNFGSFSPTVNVQNCQSSQCNQNNIGGGGGGSGGFGLGLGLNIGLRPPTQSPGFFPLFQPSYNQQNCLFSQCNQNNFRGKRQAGDTQSESSLVCEGGLAGSSCGGSQCHVSCADGVTHSVSCDGGGSRLSSSALRSGAVLVTVTCVEAPTSPLPACFPLCGSQGFHFTPFSQYSGGFGRKRK